MEAATEFQAIKDALPIRTIHWRAKGYTEQVFVVLMILFMRLYHICMSVSLYLRVSGCSWGLHRRAAEGVRPMHTLACSFWNALPPQDVSRASALPAAVELTELDSMR